MERNQGSIHIYFPAIQTLFEDSANRGSENANLINYMKETSQHKSQHENIDFKAVKLNIGNGQTTKLS